MKASSLSTAYICVYTRTYTRVLSYVYSSKDIEVASSENGKNGSAKALKYSRKRDRWPVSKGTLTFFRMLDGGEAAVRRQVEQQRPVSGQLLEPAREEYLYLAVGRLVQQVLVRIVPPRGPVLGARIRPGPERHPAGRRRVVKVIRIVPRLPLQGLKHPEHVHRQLTKLHLVGAIADDQDLLQG